MIVVSNTGCVKASVQSDFLSTISLSAWSAKVSATNKGKIIEASAYTWRDKGNKMLQAEGNTFNHISHMKTNKDNVLYRIYQACLADKRTEYLEQRSPTSSSPTALVQLTKSIQ